MHIQPPLPHGIGQPLFQTFINDNLKVPALEQTKIKLKTIVQLNRPPNNQIPRIMLIFEDITSRNICLKYRKNLERGIYCNTQVPSLYLPKHKDFERQAKDLRLHPDIITRIDFSGIAMQLKYATRPPQSAPKNLVGGSLMNGPQTLSPTNKWITMAQPHNLSTHPMDQSSQKPMKVSM